MNLPLKWSLKDCASTLYACKFPLEEEADIDIVYKKKKKDCKMKKCGCEKENSRKKQPSVVDKDYIVFRFKDNGGIDMVEEKSPSNQNRAIEQMKQNHKTLKELMFRENSEGSKHALSVSESDGGSRILRKELRKGDGNVDGGYTYMKVMTKVEASAKLSGSFAFPVLNMEMKGSPERMPIFDKRKGRVLFPCCKRF